MHHPSLGSVVGAFLWSTYASYWSDGCNPQQSQSLRSRWEEEREGVMKDRWETGGKKGERREEWWWVTEWDRKRGRGRKESLWGEGGWARKKWGGRRRGRRAEREEGRSYECWPLSLYINLHINCIKWDSPCFLIFSSLAVPFSLFLP